MADLLPDRSIGMWLTPYAAHTIISVELIHACSYMPSGLDHGERMLQIGLNACKLKPERRQQADSRLNLRIELHLKSISIGSLPATGRVGVVVYLVMPGFP